MKRLSLSLLQDRLRSERGDIVEAMFMICASFGAILLVVMMINNVTQSEEPSGIVLDKEHVAEQTSTAFFIGETPEVTQEEAYVLHLDTDQDEQADEEVTVDKEVYESFEKGQNYPAEDADTETDDDDTDLITSGINSILDVFRF